MPRSRLTVSYELPYHVTVRTNNREPFPLPLDDVWNLSADHLWQSQVIYGTLIHAFVLMPNHFHLVLTTPKNDLGKTMQLLVSGLTKSMNTAAKRSGHIFQGPYHRTLIGTPAYYGHALKYVFRNPVKASLSESVESWRYSSLRFVIGSSRPLFSVSEPLLPLDTNVGHLSETRTLEWLNRDYRDHAAAERIRKIFRSNRVDSLRDRKTRLPLEEVLKCELDFRE